MWELSIIIKAVILCQLLAPLRLACVPTAKACLEALGSLMPVEPTLALAALSGILGGCAPSATVPTPKTKPGESP